MKGWRTLFFAIVTGLIGVLAMPEFQSVIPREYLPAVLIAVGVVNAILRAITTTPIGRRE